MRIYNPIYPSIKDRLEELFGKPPTSITLTSYSAQYSIADQGTCKIKGYVYPQDAVNQQVLITYTSQKGDSTLTYSINYGEDSTGKYFEISVSTITEDVYSITVKAKGSQSVQADIFTLTAVSEVPIMSVEITKIAPTLNEITVGGDVVLSVSILPTNYTENISVQGTINGTPDVEYGEIEKTESNGYQITFTTSEAGSFTYGATITKENGETLKTQSFDITVKKAITSMTDSEITAHLSKRRYQNLMNYFESFDELSEFVQAKDYHDIYIGDYIPIAIPFTHSSNGSTTQSGSYTVNFRVVDINYLLDKTAANVSSQHLVLMPDNPIGECAMTKGEQYQDELVEISDSGYYQNQGRGYHNNNMTLNALPRILTSLKAHFGSSHILSFNDSVPIYYSDWYGGYMTKVTYQAAPNTQIRLPTRITMNGITLADSNAVWTQQFRLYQTDTNYQYTQKPAISGITQGRSGCLLTDLYSLEQGNRYASTLDLLYYRIQDGGGGSFTFDYLEGPVCPIIIFG